MQKSLKSSMEVGIVHFMAYPQTMSGEGPVLESLEAIASDPFFDAIEVGWVKDPALRQKAGELLASSGLRVGFGAQPILLMGKWDLNAADEEHRCQAVGAVKGGIDQARELGATRVAFLSGKDPGESGREAAIRRLIQSIEEIMEYAGGLEVVLETFDRDIDKRCLVGPNALGVQISREVRKKYPNFGLMVDLSHLPQQREGTAEALEMVKEHLVHVHVGNCVLGDKNHPAYGDAHPRLGIPGGENGVPELAAFLKGLFQVGYLGRREANGRLPVVSFEVKPLPGESSQVVIANAKRTLERAWALISE